MNKNKQLKRALSCSLALIMPVTAYVPSMVTVHAENQTFSFDRQSREVGETVTFEEFLKSHLQTIVDSNFNSFNFSILQSNASLTDGLRSEYQGIKQFISDSTISDISSYYDVSRNVEDKIENLIDHYVDACNQFNQNDHSGFNQCTPGYQRYLDMILYNHEQDGGLNTEGFTIDYLNNATVSDPANLLDSGIADDDVLELYTGGDYEPFADGQTVTALSVDSDLTQGLIELNDGETATGIYPQMTPKTEDGEYLTTGEHIIRDVSGDYTYYGMQTLTNQDPENGLPQYIVKVMTIEYDSVSDERTIHVDFYYEYLGQMYQASVAEVKKDGTGDFLTQKNSISEIIERIQSDVIGDKTYADGKTCQVYSNDQKSVVIDTAYGNERTQVQNILTKFEQDIQTVANTTSGIQFEMELERFEQALERSLSVIPDETTLENTLYNMSNTAAKARLDEVEKMFGSGNDKYPADSALKTEITTARNSLLSATTNDEVLAIMMAFEDAFDREQSNAQKEFELAKANALANKFTLDGVLDGFPHTKDEYSEEVLQDMQDLIDEYRETIENLTLTNRILFYTPDVTTSVSRDVWCCDGYWAGDSECRTNGLYTDTMPEVDDYIQVCPHCGTGFTYHQETDVNYRDPDDMLSDYLLELDTQFIMLQEALKDENEYPTDISGPLDAAKGAIQELDNYVDSLGQDNYSETNWTAIQTLYDLAVNLINLSRDEDVIWSIVEEYKSYMDEIPTLEAEDAEQEDQELQNAIKAAISELTEYPNSKEFSEANLAKVNRIVNNYVSQIQVATSKEDVASLLDEAKAAIDAIPTVEEEPEQPDPGVLEEIKENAIDELNSYMKAIAANYSPEAYEKIEQIVENAIEQIKVAENAEEIAEISNNAKEEIRMIATATGEVKEELRVTREAAIAQLESYCNRDDYTEDGWSDVQTILNFYKDKISKAPSVVQVNKVVERAKAALDEVKTKDELAAEEAWYQDELEKAKERAEKDINSIDLSLYREAEATVLKNSMDDAVVELDTVTKLEEVARVVRYVHYAEVSLMTDAEYTKLENAVSTDFLKLREQAMLQIEALNLDAYRLAERVQLKAAQTTYKGKILECTLPSELDAVLNEWLLYVEQFKTDEELTKEENESPIPENVVVIGKDGDTGIDMENEYYLYLNESNKDIHHDAVANSTSSTAFDGEVRITEVVYNFASGIQKRVRTTYNTTLDRKLIQIDVLLDEQIVASRTVSLASDVDNADLVIDPDVIALEDALMIANKTLDAVDLNDYRTAQRETVTQLLDETRISLEGATSADTVNSIMSQFNQLLSQIPTDDSLSYEESDEYLLQQAQESYLAQVDTLVNASDYRAEEQEQLAELKAVVIDNINNAKTAEEVETLFAEFEEDVKALKTAAQYEEEEAQAEAEQLAQEEALKLAKTEAIQAVKDSVAGKEYRESGAARVQSLIDEYTDLIQKATTVQEVTELKQEAIDELEKIETHDEITANEMADKTTQEKVESSADGGKNDRTDGTPESVQTGDVNPVVGLGILGGISAICGTIYAFFKKKK